MRASVKCQDPNFTLLFFWLVLVWPWEARHFSTIVRLGHFKGLWLISLDPEIKHLNISLQFLQLQVQLTMILYCFKTDFVQKIMKQWRWESKNFVHNKGSLGTKWKQQSWDHGRIQLWELFKTYFFPTLWAGGIFQILQSDGHKKAERWRCARANNSRFIHLLPSFSGKKNKMLLTCLGRSLLEKNCALGLLKTSGTVSSNHGPPSRGKNIYIFS